jgi:hypothetical protein
MKIGKLALTLAGLVIIGLLIISVLTGIIPATFDYLKCVFEQFLNPATVANNGACVAKFTAGLKFN